MASLGLIKTQGGNTGDPLTVAWKQAVQGQLQSEEDRIEAVKAVHDGIVAALRVPVQFAIVCMAAGAAAALALVGFKIAEVFGG